MSDALSSAARLPDAPPAAGTDYELIIRKVLGQILSRSTDEVSGNAHLRADLGSDSLDSLEIWMALEEEFLVDLDDTAVAKCQRVSDLVALVRAADERADASGQRSA